MVLINLMIDYAEETKVSADTKAAADIFAIREMSNVQGIIQGPGVNANQHVLQLMVSQCTNSIELVCDAKSYSCCLYVADDFQSTPSAKHRLRSMDNDLGALKRDCGYPDV